jgi:hypothetical protein
MAALFFILVLWILDRNELSWIGPVSAAETGCPGISEFVGVPNKSENIKIKAR